MSSFKRVAVAGASGSIGVPIVKELLASSFEVTALSRHGSKSTFPNAVKVANVDYNDVESLKKALQDQDAIVSTLGAVDPKQQGNLLDAAIAVGVKRYVPSEFGCDLTNPKARSLPVYANKVKIEEELEKKCPGTGTSYTLVFNNAFFDWGLSSKFLMDIKGKKMTMYDGGEKTFTTTPLSFVAKGVISILQHPEETANRSIRLHGTRLTQKKLLEIAQRHAGADGWQITEVSSADTEKKSYENLKNDPSNFFAWGIGFIHRAIFGEGYGGDFSSNNDNALLGLTEMSEQEVEDTIKSNC